MARTFLPFVTGPQKRDSLCSLRGLLRRGGELHVADWGKAQNLLMRTAFLAVQALDGFETTADNVAGRLADLMREAGFTSVSETHREMTMLGTLSLYKGHLVVNGHRSDKEGFMMKRIFLNTAMVFVVLGCAAQEAPGSAGAAASASSSNTMMAAMSAAAPLPASSAGTTQGWSRVEPDQVCMVNNQFMGVPQIPVQVEGKTYFGCCEMCKGRLAKDPSSRTATDPVSKREVDKASAVIAKNERGAVMYFENESSLATYLQGQSP